MILGSRTWSNWRSWLRLLSALTMLAFVICHLTAHCFLLISFDDAETARRILMYPWRGWTGTLVLSTAFLIHYTNALWSIYVRRSLRLKPWEWTQLALGLCIPVLLTAHVVGTRISEHVLDTTTYYNTVFIAQWVIDPWLSAVQMLAIVTVWTHACIGINYWLRVRTWYPKWRPFLFTYALLLPTLALAGYVTGGNQVLREAKDHDFVDSALADANLTDENRAALAHMADIGWILCFTLPLLPFAGRGLRDWYHRSQRPPILAHASGRSMRILPGATVLETLRANGVAHASVCGGRARCTTCRIMVTKGLDDLPPPSALEAKALSRIGATEGTRLACQIRPTSDIAVMPLLGADASAADGATRGGLEGSERLVTVVFVDLRGSTTLGEARLPYDVLFILNQFFYEMTRALVETNGHYSQFTGDGLMALYGLHAANPKTGAADALRGARAMLQRLDALNHTLRTDLREPLRIGIGIHYSEAIVGAMGPPHSQIITAIGDTVNTCARLESLCKDYQCTVVVSRQAAEAAGLKLGGCELHQAPVKGRNEPVQFYALQSLAEVQV
ncbi:MAG TPA: adenylate/guanylate cyclase domain-containing protein [Xanthobacteraceae bacterium]|jgi:adenylate cyclase|nr:adenylate/guanylate cyclase domain-containing protein [Xanthobacteraceae bacterium]